MSTEAAQFTVHKFVRAVKDLWCHHSMDGRGVWRDNTFVERLWRLVKYKRCMYMSTAQSLKSANRSCNAGIGTIDSDSIRNWSIPDTGYVVMPPRVDRAALKLAENPLEKLGLPFKRMRPLQFARISAQAHGAGC